MARERELPSGKLLTSASSETQKKFKLQASAQPAGAKALLAPQQKLYVKYDPTGCPPLVTVSIAATVTTAVSPDAGLTTLTDFLAGAQSSLVVGMYDFTSAEILSAFKDDLASSGKSLQMVLDDPAPNPTRDQTDWQTVQDLESTLGTSARIAWALTRSDHFATAWSFPYAYHIKVIVRDRSALWLSSGNLNRSNEPDPKAPPATEDRDWHIIIENPGLAQTFAAYLDYDYQSASRQQVSNQREIEKAIEDARAKRAQAANPLPPHKPRTPTPGRGSAGAPVAAKVSKGLSLKVTPLLTPDTLQNGQGQYLTNIVKLINGAQRSIDIQLQYIEASKGDGSPYEQLLQAIADQIRAGRTVRLIVSANYAEKWGEKMKAEGVDLTANIHT